MAPQDANFADRLIARVRELGHPLCVGLDPHLDRIPTPFRRGDMRASAPETAEAVAEFLSTVIDRLVGRVAVVKPQIAFFEQLGWRGVQVLEAVCAQAREAGIEVLLDAKRGDIGSTADGYAAAYLEPGAACEVDAITLNPYLGLDTLEPFARRCETHARGMFVLVKTSNPGSGDYQDRSVGEATLYELVSTSLADLSKRLVGPATGWSSLGVVVGATYPGEAGRVRERLPNALFLIPGYGAQGGSAAAAVQGFVEGPSGLEGGIVNSSRGVLFPEASMSWEEGFESALTQAIDELGEAVRR